LRRLSFDKKCVFLPQVLKAGLVKRVTLREVPGLVLLLKEGEELHDLMKLSREEILIRWVNRPPAPPFPVLTGQVSSLLSY